MKKVAGYVRVSTQEQADEGYSISEQQDRLKKYCDAQGWTLVHVYTDPGYSGAKLDRPALQQLLTDIPSGAFDTVLVFKLDRLSRSQKDTMYLLEDQFIKNNIDFCSIIYLCFRTRSFSLINRTFLWSCCSFFLNISCFSHDFLSHAVT